MNREEFIRVPAPASPGAFDWNVIEVVQGEMTDTDKTPPKSAVQYVAVGCGCVGVWSGSDDVNYTDGQLVGYAKMCYAHESFKLLARVWQSSN